MSIPSPDRAIVEAADRLLALPQKAGRPLPAILLSLDACLPALHVTATAGIAASGMQHSLPVALAYGLGVGAWVLASTTRSLRTLRADARSWGPEVAKRYRSLALGRREKRAAERSMYLVALFIVLVALANALNGVGVESRHLVVLPLAFVPFLASMVLREYARCAMPRDPDLRQVLPRAA